MTKLIRIACVVGTALIFVGRKRRAGVDTGRLRESELLAMTLGATFCIPKSGNLLVDFLAQLPGPGVVSAPGELDLSQVLPLGLFSP